MPASEAVRTDRTQRPTSSPSQVRLPRGRGHRPAPPAGRRARRTPAASSSGSPTPSARWPAVTSQNERLAQTLREARDQIMKLKEEVDRLAQPPAGFGTFLARNEDDSIDVFTGGRKLRVNVSPSVDLDDAAARPGGHAQRGPQRRRRARLRAGRRGRDVQGAARRRRAGPGDRERRRGARRPPRRAAARPTPCAPATRCCSTPAPATSTRRCPKSEVEELVLEEVPDIDYDVDRRPGRPDRADPRRGRAALPAPRAVHGAPAQAAQGRAALRPARLRQDADRQGGRELAGQEGRRQDRPGGEVLLPQHQGPRAAQQVRRRDRAAHPPGLPAGPREGQRGHPGHRVLRRDGLAVPHPRLRASPPTSRTPSSRSCSARSTASRRSRTSW